MIYLTVTNALAVLLATGLAVAMFVERKHNSELIAHLEVQHQAERARFLAAVQRPDLVQPPTPIRQRTAEQVERDRARAREMATVGTIQHAKPGRE